jgi:hypothetical protein
MGEEKEKEKVIHTLSYLIQESLDTIYYRENHVLHMRICVCVCVCVCVRGKVKLKDNHRSNKNRTNISRLLEENYRIFIWFVM